MATARNLKTWTLVLRCYACDGKFTQRHLTFDRVSALPRMLPCPFCTARPGRRAGPSQSVETHHVVDLEDETDHFYRKTMSGDMWHFAAGCSNWPLEDFIELDGYPVRGELCNECRALANFS
jgi:hypothetical protein